MTQDAYRAQVDARAQQIIDYRAEQDGRGLWEAHVLFAKDQHHGKMLDIVKNGLGDRTSDPGGRPTGGPFHIFPCMALACRWPDKMPAEALDVIKEFMTEGVLERGNTENHWLMYYVGNLLAAEMWPDLPRTWNGLRPEAMREEAMRWILGMINRTALNGHHEYDSPQYHIEHMVPMIAVADLAQDPHLRKQAEQVLSLYVADMALEYFHGAWAGGHSREGYRENTWRRSGAIGILQYLFFGGEDFDPQYHAHGFGIPATTARYRPPAIFAEIAWDRAKPHVVKKTKAPRTIYRCVEQEARPVRKYTYMSPSFALGTTQTGLPGPMSGPIDLISWDLTWKGENQSCKVTFNHPYRHPDRFSAFLVGYPQHIGHQIGSDKPYLQWPDRLFGASPYERMMQHEGAAIIAYRIPEDDETPYANLYLPRTIAWVERDGWIMGDTGAGAYIALHPIGNYTWSEIRETGTVRFMTGNPNQVDGWMLRIPDVHAGLIIEAAEASDIPSFDDFCDRRTALSPDLSGWPAQDRIAVDTVAGHHLELIYDGLHRVDGEVLDYEAYPLYEAPGASAAVGVGRMTFRREDQVVDLDFEADASKPLMPIRVIG